MPVLAAQFPLVVSAAAFTLAIASRSVHLPLLVAVLSSVLSTTIVAADAVASSNNTISSKSADLEVTNCTIEARGEIEKLKEQTQNVE